MFGSGSSPRHKLLRCTLRSVSVHENVCLSEAPESFRRLASTPGGIHFFAEVRRLYLVFGCVGANFVSEHEFCNCFYIYDSYLLRVAEI